MNKKLLIFLLWTLPWINLQIEQNLSCNSLLEEQNEDLYSAYCKTPITTIKTCNTQRGTGPTRGPITRPTQGIDPSLIWMMVAKKGP